MRNIATSSSLFMKMGSNLVPTLAPVSKTAASRSMSGEVICSTPARPMRRRRPAARWSIPPPPPYPSSLPTKSDGPERISRRGLRPSWPPTKRGRTALFRLEAAWAAGRMWPAALLLRWGRRRVKRTGTVGTLKGSPAWSTERELCWRDAAIGPFRNVRRVPKPSNAKRAPQPDGLVRRMCDRLFQGSRTMRTGMRESTLPGVMIYCRTRQAGMALKSLSIHILVLPHQWISNGINSFLSSCQIEQYNCEFIFHCLPILS
mmetsp:Transcript_35304/g.81763  ORF Transcript_35304/g.81763 Transcript_35304/m.81763 type:complete len:260 (-) Transcript_35304:728-1507(-)